MICSTGNAGGNRKQKKRQSAHLRKSTLCKRETVVFLKKTLKLTKDSIAQF